MLPKVAACAVLITSRHSGELGGVRKQELKLFSPEEAREYLRDHLEPSLLARSDDATLDAVALETDHLPLALELVVSYLHETRQTPGEWLEEWRRSPVPTINFHDVGSVNYPVSLARVWERSVDRLSLAAHEFLNALSWIAPRPATFPLQALKASEDWLNLRNTLSELAKASLVSWPLGKDEVFIHRVLQTVTRYGQKDDQRTSSLERACALVEASLPDPAWNEIGWRLWEQLAPHIRTLLSHVEDSPLEIAAGRIINQYGFWLFNRGQYSEAEPLCRRVLKIHQENYGPDYPGLVTDLSNLATLLKDTNRLKEAEALFRRGLAIAEKAFESDDLIVAAILNNFAEMLRAMNRPEEAEPLASRAITISEKIVGSDDPVMAPYLNNFAELLRVTKRFEEAETFYRRALTIVEKSSGPDNPSAAAILNNLGLLLRRTKRFNEAERLYRQALRIDEKTFGPVHPNVGRDLNNLGILLYRTNRLEEAEQVLRRAVSIDEKIFGPDHPTVANDISSLATLLQSTNRFEEAAPLVKRSMQIFAEFKRETGQPHPFFAVAIEEGFSRTLRSRG